jgi:hypothetical protein
VKRENGDLLADSHNISNRWKNYCSQYVRQIKIHTAEPLVLDHIHFEVEIAIAKFEKSINCQVVIRDLQNH